MGVTGAEDAMGVNVLLTLGEGERAAETEPRDVMLPTVLIVGTFVVGMGDTLTETVKDALSVGSDVTRGVEEGDETREGVCGCDDM